MTATAHPADDEPPLYVGEIVEIIKDHPWGGCLVVVTEVRSWGCVAELRMPDGVAPIRLHAAEIMRLWVKVQHPSPPAHKPLHEGPSP